MNQSDAISTDYFDALLSFQEGSSGPDRPWPDSGFADLSEDLATANDAPTYYHDPWMTESAVLDLSNNSTAVSSPLTPGTPISRPKLGSRFSRDVIRTLKDWLAVHQRHPYPNDSEFLMLQERTGMNKGQLTNWFANARRRGKVQSIRPASPKLKDGPTTPVDIIPRPGTPAVVKGSHYKDPMQRWVESPPEHEPAAVRDIARAVAGTSNGDDANELAFHQPWQSPYAVSSASSAGTSHSSEFSGHHSSGSQSSLKLRRAPRRKRASRHRRIEKEPTAPVIMPYQCTFCTEVFKTKYDWQRHEKSIHLPLERWICALHGPRTTKDKLGEDCCVFCGKENPDDSHVETHHYSACQERNLAERTFHRKDHLVQHLRLVHNSDFVGWSMTQWMLPMPNVQSRCGFCSITMSTWVERTDHLADHFKAGVTMASWRGDWGFDDATANIVETAIPPYLIEWERGTLIPMKASDPSWGTPPNAYELLKVEIEFFIQQYYDKYERLPDNDAIQLEACRIIFSAEAYSCMHNPAAETTHNVSWLSDLIMSSPKLTHQARFGPIRTSRESRHFPLRINAKDHLFEMCPMEMQLHAFITDRQMSGAVLDDGQLHHEACQIIRKMEEESSTPSDIFANWIVKGIYSGLNWLSHFKQRAGIFDGNLAVANGSEPVVGFQWSQPSLPVFAEDILHRSAGDHNLSTVFPTLEEDANTLPPAKTQLDTYGRLRDLLPDDTNFYRIFDNDMRRWAAATLSPKNPNCHVPSDEEIQHQARWIMYDGDDPWNQTPADYPDWLWQFKKEVGISVGVEAVDPKVLVMGPQ